MGVSESCSSPSRGPSLSAALLGIALAGCSGPVASRRHTPSARPTSTLSKARLRELRARESELREGFSPAEQPSWLDVSGADPYRIVPQPAGGGFVGLLRGSKALVSLNDALNEQARVALPITPTALCVSTNGDAWVASRYDARLVRVRRPGSPADAELLQRELPVSGVADVACGEHGIVYVLPADGSALLTLDERGRVLGSWPALKGPLRLRREGQYLLEISLFERSVRALLLSTAGPPLRELGTIRHDGTLWAAEAGERAPHGLFVAVAGVEDKPLVRAHGEFENIDSFVWLYELGAHGFEQRAELDVSDFGVVVPKALRLGLEADEVTLDVLGAGSGRLLHARWRGAWQGAPAVSSEPAPPGVSDAVAEPDGRFVYASPLLDAWVELDRGGVRVTRVDPERRPAADVRLGEALFFTELMAPNNSSQGTHSRFTCETCHFEGGLDGRIHYTGRGDVSVVTKPLFGLANNRPHFSRAMDPDLSSVCHNEFRVAGAGSGTDPWFTLDAARFPWLHELGIDRGELDPLGLRSALLRFLYAFSHAPNPNSQGRAHFTQLEAAGAAAFREHCQGCHAARLFTDDAQSTLPFEAWERLIFARNAPLVWARGDYAKTGVLPYVHERGTRITSLRRLALKPRYFTNGSAPDLESVLERFREGSGSSWHQSQDSGLVGLDASTRRALLAFLRLL